MARSVCRVMDPNPSRDFKRRRRETVAAEKEAAEKEAAEKEAAEKEAAEKEAAEKEAAEKEAAETEAAVADADKKAEAQDLCDHPFVYCCQDGYRVPYSEEGFVCPHCELLCELDDFYPCGMNCDGCCVTPHWGLWPK